MARRYIRDARGRFAPKGYSGQTGGRGARLKSGKGNIRQVGGQKRGERHILRSPESKAAGKRSFDASVAHARLTLPKNLGGQGMPRDSFLAQAARAKKVDGFKSTTYVENGITSGEAASDVAFHHTFTEDTTFYYACQPHIAMDMFGEIVVGDGGSEPAAESSDETEDTPGFMVAGTIVAVIGALALMGRTKDDN